MKFTLKNLAIREKFILFAQRLFDFILLGNIVFWGGFGIIFFGEDRYNWSPISFIIWVIGGLSTLGIVFRRKELSQKQGFLKFWKSSFLYIAGYFRNAPQEQERIEPSPRKKLKVKRVIIGCVLLLLVTSAILFIQYRKGNQKSSVSSITSEVTSTTHEKEAVDIPSEGADMPLTGGLTNEVYQKLRFAGHDDYEIIQRLQQDRADVRTLYDGWLREGVDARGMVKKLIEHDAKRIKLIEEEFTQVLGKTDVEIFDMRLRGTGGYKAISGRVQNKSAMEITEIRLSVTLYRDGKIIIIRRPIDSGTATISCSIPPFAVRSVTGDVTEMTLPEPLRESAPWNPTEEMRRQRKKEGWEYVSLGSRYVWQKASWVWSHQILSVTGSK